MSQPEQKTVKCPDCGKEIAFTLWSSINTALPNAAEDIISGKLFEIECKHCGLKTTIDYPMLFNDMEHNTWVWYVLPEQVDETVKMFEVTKKGELGSFMHFDRRIVTSQAALREKACILSCGLDDRIVELLKLFILNEIRDQIDGKEVNSIYFNKNEDTSYFELIIDGQPAFIEINMEGYKFLESQFYDAVRAKSADDYFIDSNWAYKFLEEENGQHE